MNNKQANWWMEKLNDLFRKLGEAECFFTISMGSNIRAVTDDCGLFLSSWEKCKNFYVGHKSLLAA